MLRIKALKWMSSIILAMASVFGAVSIAMGDQEVKGAVGTGNFIDVPASYWAKASIQKALDKGYVNGYPGGYFKPNANVTRAEFIKMVVNALELSSEKKDGKWYEEYVAAAMENNLYLAEDFGNNEDEWSKPITREEMARMAVRATGERTNESDKWMYLATRKGLISGLGAGKLGLKEKTTRAQSVTIIDRILTVKSGGALKVDKYALANAEIVWHRTNIFTVMPEIFVDSKTPENVEELWKEENMVIESKDGNWKGELLELVAIDLADPNDPNLRQIPPVRELKWQNRSSSSYDGMPLEKWKNSYLLYFKTKIIHNKDSKRYADYITFIPLSFQGMNSPDWDKFKNGYLNAPAWVYHKKPSDSPYLVVPKSSWKQNARLSIEVYTPALSGFYLSRNIILDVSGPLWR